MGREEKEGVMDAPIAFLVLCLLHPDVCTTDTVGSVQYTPQLAQKMQNVQTAVNGSIRPRAEAREEWTVNPRSGDCEDYALTKRERLRKLGVPLGALRIAVATYRGEGHAVLVVKTDSGDFILDYLRTEVVTKSQAKKYLNFKSISGADPYSWKTY